jgi:hypothetical protein
MQIAEYYTIRRGIRNSAPAPDAEAMSAMQIELRAALLASGLFHTVEVGRTDDADRLVIAMCEFAPETDAAEAALALARLWTKQVAYGFWQANTLRVDKGHVELQGATRLSLFGHYVTVHLVAQEAPTPTRVVEQSVRERRIPSIGISAVSSSGHGNAVA